MMIHDSGLLFWATLYIGMSSQWSTQARRLGRQFADAMHVCLAIA